MRKILTTLFIMLICTVCLFAQSGNKYVVKLKNGIDVECVSYKLTADNNIEVTYADGSTVSIKMDDVEKVSPIEAKNDTNVQKTQQAVKPVQQPSQPVQQSYQQTQQQVVYGNQSQLQPAYIKPPRNPTLAGFLSFFIPGVGQFYNGHVGAGVGFLLGNIVLSSLSFRVDGNTLYFYPVFFAGWIALDVWAIIHAVKGAKRENIARGYAAGGQYLDISPVVLTAPSLAHNGRHSGAYGMSFGMRF